MEFVDWAEEEIRRAGLFDEDSDYEGMLGAAVMALVRAHAGQGHSGFSAALAVDVFQRLAAWKPLTPLTSDPAEWIHVDAEMAGNATTWQSRRAPSCFSRDGGKTWHDIDEPSRWQRFKRQLRGRG